jgi:hypothetical protein
MLFIVIIGNPLSKAQVMVQTDSGTFTQTTDNLGTSIFNLTVGTYQLTVTSPNSLDYQGKLSVSSLDDLTVEVLLPNKGNQIL